jgi:hypothetical protein
MSGCAALRPVRRALSEAGALAVASVIVGVSTGFTVGFYEYFAYRANW